MAFGGNKKSKLSGSSCKKFLEREKKNEQKLKEKNEKLKKKWK
jgi:hypothetical protein